MFDTTPDDNSVFDFDELADHLLEQGVDASPARLHGCLCGLLCAGAGFEAERGLDGLTQALELHVHGELAESVLRLYAVSAAAMADEELSFHLLLPDDEVDIDSRTGALADWCKGFLAGFAHSSAHGRGDASMTEENTEILRDIGAIAEAAVGEDESEEESEGSYAELVEYLRCASLNLFLDLNAESRPEPDEPPVMH
ncbi:MAG: UPF0149 family protein [Halioglobus sp.]|nr:UPF0149 family protein [Halioglobus sp.]